jgi:hypothetical protein
LSRPDTTRTSRLTKTDEFGKSGRPQAVNPARISESFLGRRRAIIQQKNGIIGIYRAILHVARSKLRIRPSDRFRAGAGEKAALTSGGASETGAGPDLPYSEK